jgi:hypothetical protein
MTWQEMRLLIPLPFRTILKYLKIPRINFFFYGFIDEELIGFNTLIKMEVTLILIFRVR